VTALTQIKASSWIFLSCKFDMSFNRNVVATFSVFKLKSISVSLVLVSTEMVEQNKKFSKYAELKLAFIKEYDDNIGSGCWKIFQKDCTVYQASKYILQNSVADNHKQ
jgi:hypothetical protein